MMFSLFVGRQTAVMVAIVNVRDVNDHDPIFSQLEYNFVGYRQQNLFIGRVQVSMRVTIVLNKMLIVLTSSRYHLQDCNMVFAPTFVHIGSFISSVEHFGSMSFLLCLTRNISPHCFPHTTFYLPQTTVKG